MNIDLQLFAADTGETWVLNDTVDVSTMFDYYVDFTSNNTSYTRFAVAMNNLRYYDGGFYDVYNGSTWTNTAYKTVTFSTSPSGDLLTWLQSNGTKQSTIHFKHYYKGDAIGTGAVKFRDYSQSAPLPQLATPTNVTADGTTVS